MDKLMKTAKKLDTFFKVVQKIMKTIMIVIVCVLGVLTIANIINPDTTIAKGFYSVDIGPLTIKLTESYSQKDNNMVLLYVWFVIGLAAVAVVAIYYAFGQIRKILQPMSEGNPFHPTVSMNIRKVAYVSVVLGVVANIVSFVESFNVLRIIDKLNLLQPAQEEIIQSVTANYRFDITFLVVFFILMLMSYIFRYGEELQQQVDETL